MPHDDMHTPRTPRPGRPGAGAGRAVPTDGRPMPAPRPAASGGSGARPAARPARGAGNATARAASRRTQRRSDALDDAARAVAIYNTAPEHLKRVTRPTSSAAAERALDDARRRRGRTARIMVCLIVLAAVAAVVISVVLLRDRAVTDVDADARAFIAGQRVDLAAPIEIARHDGAWVATAENGATLTLDGRPLYVDGRAEAYLGEGGMVVLPARQGAIRQVPARTRAVASDGLVSLVSHRDATEAIESGFIYDGADTYTLLTEGRLSTSAGELILPALSSVEAVYGGSVCVYDYGAGTMQVFDAERAVLTVEDGTTSYELDMLSDTLTRDGATQLLLGDASSMPSIFDK